MTRRASARDTSDLLDVRAAATLARRNPETVRRWIWSGRLAARRRGNRLFVAREDLEALAHTSRGGSGTLADWAARARGASAGAASPADGRTAADLVFEDRERRARTGAA